MPVLYGRQIKVTVAGLIVDHPRISFEVQRTADQTQTTGHVKLYNLADARAKRIQDRGGPIVIEAGYPETIATVFDGQVERVQRARDGHAHVTDIKLGDQVRQKDKLGGVTTRSYDGPVPVRQIVMDLAADIKLPLGPLDAIPADATETNWYWANQSVAGLNTVLRGVQCTWYEQDGVIRINTAGMKQSDAPTLNISPRNGLIAVPIETDEGAEIRTFLDPRIVLGAQINLESMTLSGSWKVVSLRHYGDNWESNPFVSWADLRAL